MKRIEDLYCMDSVTINVTNKCNLSCSYCFESVHNDEMMSEKMICDILDKSYRKLDDMKFMVNLFGGEPMLNWKAIKAAVLHADKMRYDIRFGITTNLTILTEEMIDMIDEYGIVLLVSFDGIERAHDMARCNSWAAVDNNLKRLKDRGLSPLVEVRMTVTPENIQYFYKGVKYIYDMGYDHIVPCLQTDTDWSAQDIHSLKYQYQKVLDFYIEELNNLDTTRNLGIRLVDDYLYANLEPFSFDNKKCAIGTNRWCSIGVHGEVMPCHQWHTSKEYKDKYFGFIDGELPENVFFEPKPFEPFDKCNGCNAMTICKGGCPTQNFINTGDEAVPTDGFCRTSKALADITVKAKSRVLQSSNPRSRKLVQLRENLQLKEYFDDVVCTADIFSPDFPLILQEFESKVNNIAKFILPSFNAYFTLKMYPLTNLITGGEQVG